MFYRYDHESCRLLGRWVRGENAAVTTAVGSSLRIAFRGAGVVLRFDMAWCTPEYPHLWLSVDGGAKIEAPLAACLRAEGVGDGEHVLDVIYKSANDEQHRWHEPLVGKVAFRGYEAERSGVLPKVQKPLLEVVGDSITEGILVDADLYQMHDALNNRPFEDDVTAAYHYLTAAALGWEETVMGYSAVGCRRKGAGGVPAVCEAYPFCYEGERVQYDREPDYILINHGANDRFAPEADYIETYRELLDIVIAAHPKANVIALAAFCGAHHDALRDCIAAYNAEGHDVFFVSTEGWVPPEPLHPLRGAHREIADRLIPILREKYHL